MGTISRALNLLNFFSEKTPELGLMEFKKLSGMDKATVHRYLVELLANGYLEQNAASRKYRLGSAFLRLAAVRERSFPTGRIVASHVDALSESCGELVHAALLLEHMMSPLYFADARISGIRVYFDEAEILPLHATASGIAAMAFGNPELVKRVLGSKLESYTENTISDPAELERAIAECRETGYAFADGTYEAEVSSLSVPFFQDGAYAYGAITVAIPSSRLTEANTLALASSLAQCAEAVTLDLGGRIPDSLRSLWNLAA